MKVITYMENYMLQSSLISFPNEFSILHLKVRCFLRLLNFFAVFSWVWTFQQQPVRVLQDSADCQPADMDIILVLNCGKSKNEDFVKQGSNYSLTSPGVTQLAFTVVMPDLYWGKEVQNQTYVDQRKNCKTLIKSVKRISHAKTVKQRVWDQGNHHEITFACKTAAGWFPGESTSW